jgi:Tfp pilus assembly protein PilF
VAFAVILGTAWGIHLLNREYQKRKAVQDARISPSSSFGIVVADFASGPNYELSVKGREISDLLAENLTDDLKSGMSTSGIDIKRWKKVIRSREAAEEMAERLNADLVIWGYVPVGTRDAIKPYFSFSDSSYVSLVVPLSMSDSISGLETIDLAKALSRNTIVLTKFVMGVAYLEHGDYQMAILRINEAIAITEERLRESEDLQTTTTIREDLVRFYIFRGQAQERTSNLNAAILSYFEASEVAVNSPLPFLALGNMYYQNGDWAKAEENYLVALDRGPNNAKVWYSLGNAHFSMGNVSEAIGDYRKAKNHDPKLCLAYLNLVAAYVDSNQCLEARNEYEELEQLAENLPRCAGVVELASKRTSHCGTPTPKPTLTLAVTKTPTTTPTPLPTVPPFDGAAQLIERLTGLSAGAFLGAVIVSVFAVFVGLLLYSAFVTYFRVRGRFIIRIYEVRSVLQEDYWVLRRRFGKRKINLNKYGIDQIILSARVTSSDDQIDLFVRTVGDYEVSIAEHVYIDAEHVYIDMEWKRSVVVEIDPKRELYLEIRIS